MNENILEVFKQFVYLMKNCNQVTASSHFHSIIQLFNDQFNQSVYPYYNDKNIEEKVNYALKISESYTKHQHCCIHHFIPSPVILYTWSKLLRVEVFRRMFMEIITSNDHGRISSQCSDNLCNVTESNVIDLTSRNLPVSRQLKKLESLCGDQMLSIEDLSVPAEKFTRPFCSYDESSKFASQWLLNEWSRIYHSYDDTSLQDVDCTNENPRTLNNELFSEDTLMTMMIIMMKAVNKASIANQQVGKGFYTDEEFPIKPYVNTNDIPRTYQPNSKFPWSIPCIENHSNQIQEDSFQDSLWKPSPILPNKIDTTLPDCFVKPENIDPSCSSVVFSSETNFSDVKTSFLWNTQSQSPSSSSPPPPTSYSPPLNFSAFTMDQNMLCPLCHKCFRFEKNLLRHLQKTHSTSTGESLLKCKLCNYTTRHYSNMYVHIRTHTGDKPYSCSACGVAFTQGSSLKLHIRSRHNDNSNYFSLIRKPGKNNLTKLWTRVLKKDLPKFNSFQSTSSYYYYHHHQHHRHYWNKWRNSMNIEQINRLKNIKHKSKLTPETENLNYNHFSSTPGEFQQLSDGTHTENCMNSDYWAANNTSDYKYFEPNLLEIKKCTKQSVFKTSNEAAKLKNYKRRQTNKTNSDRQLVKTYQKTETKYSSFLDNSKSINEIESYPLPTDERTTTLKLEEPDLQDSQSGRCSTIILNQLFLHDRQMNHDIHKTTDANNDNNDSSIDITHNSNMAVLNYPNKSDIQYPEEYLPFSIAALQPY